ncbi:hypothetical protein [Parapedobacter lycopersici]|uniref:hypothetical protein n=1 Tax=Parapedobacter lycopersici TaxID=1864939 RepID=UPI00214D4660|nr:hypothetical protein [Parapedobacter lycopersici]
MTSLKLRGLLIALFLLGRLLPGLAQVKQAAMTEDDQLRAQIDEWMLPYRHEKRAELTAFSRAEQHTPATIKQHPVYKRMQQFYEAHQTTYHKLRLESLRRYPPAPAELPGYEPVDMAYIERDFKGEAIGLYDVIDVVQDFSNIRTLDASDTQTALGVLSGFAFRYLTEERGMSRTDMAVRMASGSMLFADQLAATEWKLTYLNRLYAIRFHWDIHTNGITGLELLVHTGAPQAAGWIQDVQVDGYTPRLKLLHEIQAFRWSLYDQSVTTPSSGGAEQLTWDFIRAHRAEYTEMRKSALARLPRPDEAWQAAYRQEAAGLLGDLLYGLGIVGSEQLLPAAVSFAEIGYEEVFTQFQLQIAQREDTPNAGEHFLFSWLVGKEVYAREIRENVWEIIAFVDEYALQYTWNIATDELTEITCWQKK